MKEGAKTLMFLGAAVVLLGAAWFTRPKQIVEVNDAAVGQLYSDFKDPLKAKSLEIISYDEDTSALDQFKVAQVNGRWVIPSHQNYPADAEKQLAEAATSMMDLEKLGIATSNPAEHELYGVIDPKSPNLTAGAKGVGKRVMLQDAGSNTLADYIIGKSEEKQPGVRFVRIPNQDPVYRVIVSTDKLSTNFGDWIEKDLLKMNAFDIKQVVLNNHSVDELNGTMQYDSIVSFDYDSKESKWDLNDLKVGPRLVETKLKDDQEPNAEKLNELKTALDDLKIVDVSRKPEGLSADLRVDEKSLKHSSMESLQLHGFFLARGRDGRPEMVSNEGEVHAGMSDGVEYILRFGEIAGAGKKDEKKEDEKKGDKQDEKKSGDVGVNRYIMVTARFQKDLIPEPVLDEVPPVGGKAGPAAEAGPSGKPEARSNAKPEPSGKPAAKSESTKKPAAAAATKAGNKAAKPAAKTASDEKAEDAESEEPGSNANNCGEDPAAEEPGDKKDAAAQKSSAEEKPARPKTPEEIQRESIITENKRKQDEYESKLKDGEKRVKELNDRFADWYYIISNDTYQKIHLSRDQVIKTKEAPKDEAGKTPETPKDPFDLKKFNDLKSKGLKQ